jgi:hypothetical protein
LSESVKLSDAKWLLFLSEDSRLENFFAGIDIPYDCELLVAQPAGTDEFVLTEVFRVTPSLPLQMRRLGKYSDGRPMSWPSLHCCGRRDKLQGLVLKTGVIEVGFLVTFRRLTLDIDTNIFSRVDASPRISKE